MEFSVVLRSIIANAMSGSLYHLCVLLASYSEISILAIAVGAACGVILIILCIFVAVRFWRKRSMENDIELYSREHERKDPTVW